MKLSIPKSEVKRERITSNVHRKYNFDDSFITGEYEDIWEVLKSGKSFGAIKMLSVHKPDSSGSIAIYHFLYGMAYSNLGKKLIAIDEFRLAYIYAADKNLKELSLFKRAGLHQKSGLHYEARADYSIFIREPQRRVDHQPLLGAAHHDRVAVRVFSAAVTEVDGHAAPAAVEQVAHRFSTICTWRRSVSSRRLASSLRSDRFMSMSCTKPGTARPGLISAS